MPLVNLPELLEPARKGKYAVAAFDVVNTEYALALIDAAQACASPLILMVYEGYYRYFRVDLLIGSLVRAAQAATVSVAVHLDHATQWENVVRAVHYGCTSVMLDCSQSPYEENVRQTRSVVEMCRPLQVSVESEIGCVKGDEGVGRLSLTASCADEMHFTNVEEAENFVRDTGVDALAVSVGNVHGLYQGEPRLDFARLEAIASRTRIPLVLHGGTGLSDTDLRRAIKMGICKINVNTDLVLTAGQHLKQSLDTPSPCFNYPELLFRAHRAVGSRATHYLKMVRS